MKMLFCFVSLFICILILCCTPFDPLLFGPPPFVVIDGSISTESCENFQHMGFLLELKNTADSSISSLSLELMVVDSEGKPYPDYWNSIYSCAADITIKPGETRIIAIPLEDQMIQLPLIPVKVSELRILHVDFLSGEEWSDSHGFYKISF